MFRIINYLFLANLLAIISASFLIKVTGLDVSFFYGRISSEDLFKACLVYGMGSATLVLLLSRFIAKWSYGLYIVRESEKDPALAHLRQRILSLCRAAQIKNPPEIGIFESDALDAFATGPSESKALIGLSTGILHALSWEEIDAVVAHEIHHIKSGDMVLMTLLQGLLNSFTLFFSRFLAFALIGGRGRGFLGLIGLSWLYYLLQTLIEFMLGGLGLIFINWVSRRREYNADRGAAMLYSKEHIISALKKVRDYQSLDRALSNKQIPAKYLRFGERGSFVWDLFSTHPPISKRIKALRSLE